MLHHLRQSATRIGRLLAPLLLLSWMSLLCGDCFAGMAQAGTMEHGHHHMPMSHGDPDGHHCCDHPDPCLGSDCGHVLDRPALKVELKSDLFIPGPLLFPVAPGWPSSSPGTVFVPAHVPAPVSWSPPPVYLHNCVFRI